MTKEYTLPPAEGPVLRGPTQVRIFGPDEIPIEIGSLERKDLNYIGDWNTSKLSVQLDVGEWCVPWRKYTVHSPKNLLLKDTFTIKSKSSIIGFKYLHVRSRFYMIVESLTYWTPERL